MLPLPSVERMPATVALMGEAYRGFLGDGDARAKTLYLMEALSPPICCGRLPIVQSFSEWLERNRCRVTLLDDGPDFARKEPPNA